MPASAMLSANQFMRTMKMLDGKEIFKRLYKKNARRYSIYALKSEKTYRYIYEL